MKLDSTLVLRGGGRLVLEDGKPGLAVLVANTEVDRSPVTLVGTSSSPLATILCRSADRIEVVLSRGRLAGPLVIRIGVGVGDLFSLSRLQFDRDGLGFGAGIVSSADGDHATGLVGSLNTTLTRNTQALG